MLGVIGSGLAAVVFGLLFAVVLYSNLGSSSFEGYLIALTYLGLAGISVALFELTNFRKR